MLISVCFKLKLRMRAIKVRPKMCIVDFRISIFDHRSTILVHSLSFGPWSFISDRTMILDLWSSKLDLWSSIPNSLSFNFNSRSLNLDSDHRSSILQPLTSIFDSLSLFLTSTKKILNPLNPKYKRDFDILCVSWPLFIGDDLPFRCSLFCVLTQIKVSRIVYRK